MKVKNPLLLVELKRESSLTARKGDMTQNLKGKVSIVNIVRSMDTPWIGVGKFMVILPT